MCLGPLRAQARADFLHWYGRDFDRYVRTHPPLVVADLISMLPSSSCFHAAADPGSASLAGCDLLTAIECDIRRLAWGMGGCVGDEPEPMTVPAGDGWDAPDEGDMDIVARKIGLKTQ